MNKEELEHIISLTEGHIHRSAKQLRELIFSENYNSPFIEEIIQETKIDLDILLKAIRQYCQLQIEEQ